MARIPHCWALGLLLVCLALADATTVDIEGNVDDESEDGEARTIFTSGGTYYLALNTTFLLFYSIIAAGLLLAGLALSGAFSAEGASSGGYGQQYSQQGYQQRTGGEEAFRSKRQAFSTDFTDQLHILADAFNKYEVEETTCQLYVACESAHTFLHEKHGRLAKTVYEVMQNMQTVDNLPLVQNDVYLMDILDGYKIGESGQSCDDLRKSCRQQKIFLDQ